MDSTSQGIWSGEGRSLAPEISKVDDDWQTILAEGTHRCGQARSCYVTYPFPSNRHNRFRNFREGVSPLSGSSMPSSSDSIAGGNEKFPYQFEASPDTTVGNLNRRFNEPRATEDCSAAAAYVDLVHRLESCGLCDSPLASQPRAPSSFDAMEHDVHQEYHQQDLHHHHRKQNPERTAFRSEDQFDRHVISRLGLKSSVLYYKST
ncbi:hypothetical protein R1sor_020689 [Riccia sorocarpa]|uniref:Uncharacterized protein n=1 Tax=Riccia sorocarpa TaxID=122646 RepID=A0ABD3GEY0_9MARC